MSDLASSDGWVAIYKFARLAFLAFCLLGIAAWIFNPRRRRSLEEPARRMLEDDDE